MDRMEKAQEEMREQLAKIMELVASLSKGKRVVEESTPLENPPTQDTGNPRDDPPYPPRINPAKPIHVPDLDGPKEQEKLKKSSSQTGENDKDQKKYDMLEECLRAIEGVDRFGTMDAAELCLVSDVLIPAKFKIISNPSANNYDPNAKCDYHMGAIGHSIEKCRQFEEKIENLIKDGTLTFKLMESWKLTLS
ncbi:Uncharacterized protein TCM_040133 [Theobroma cacao]|uniref:Gag-pro-like protein n=1 Tax=Theobroma cacao TaxID=3641 RepID=A0A061GYS7_THECC|nr:Uncharacterized protein TCM_040133 [Theobroma cacao]